LRETTRAFRELLRPRDELPVVQRGDAMSTVAEVFDAYQAAERLCRAGFSLFPLQPGSKLPWGKWGGARGKPTDPSHWRRYPQHGFAARTGRPSEVWALDVDTAKGGMESLERLLQLHGPLPRTVEAESGGGGRHYYFMMLDGDIRSSDGKLGPGLDVKGTGGCITLPPSIHPSGNRYRWVAPPWKTEPAFAPRWLVELVRYREPPPPVPLPQVFSVDRERVLRRARLLVDAIHPAISGSGGRDDTWKVALSLARGFALEVDEALPIFSKWNSGCSPPWKESELVAKLKDAAAKGRMPMGYLLLEVPR
jgi:Bifunctional DNA primase/polymerase, N-terminal